MSRFSGEKLTVLPDQRSVGADLVVPTEIVPAQGEPTRIDYVMRRGAQGWRAVDVLLNGSISQNAVKRSDFRSLVTATTRSSASAAPRDGRAGSVPRTIMSRARWCWAASR